MEDRYLYKAKGLITENGLQALCSLVKMEHVRLQQVC